LRKLDRAWKERPLRTSARVALSLLRRRVPFLREVVVNYDAGRSRMAIDLRTALGLKLYRYPYHDPEIVLVTSLLREGDVFIDGGANVGLFSLVAAARVGHHGKVVAFEPAAATRARLAVNVGLSRFHWIDIRAEALADRQGNQEFTAFERDGAGLSSFAPYSDQGGHRERVVTVKLDSALSPADESRLRVLKLDLEGAELAALSGARELLARTEVDVFLEVEPTHLARQQASADSVFRLLEGLGYRLFRVVAGRDRRPVLLPIGAGERAGWVGGNVFASRRSRELERPGQ
jgi:FkbM family methyltransferase